MVGSGAADAPLTWSGINCVTRSPKEGCAEMHIFATTLVALTAFAVTSAQAAPIPSKAYTGNRTKLFTERA